MFAQGKECYRHFLIALNRKKICPCGPTLSQTPHKGTGKDRDTVTIVSRGTVRRMVDLRRKEICRQARKDPVVMKKNVLFRTNILVCLIIILGFVITAVISYTSNRGTFEKDVERVSTLTAEGISHNIDTIFTKPINISLTMANDSLLKDFLAEEGSHLDDEAFIQTMRDYLDAYRMKYEYDSVFLVSAQTNRYYHFKGLDRILTPDHSENVWYYEFLNANQEYSLNIDNDEAADNEITVFINCKITGPDGGTMGIVGVGFRVDSLQALLKDYEDKFDVNAYLVDPQGTIEISTDQTGYHATNLFDSCEYPEWKDAILSDRENIQDFWYSGPNRGGYLVTQFIPTLEWFLVVDHDTSALDQQLSRQFTISVLVIIAVVAFVLLTITGIIRKYNAQIIQLTVAREKEHKSIFQAAAEQLYENIYEVDISHNRAASEATEDYFESLGAPKGTSYDQALKYIAEKQIKEEFRQGYLDTFSPEHVLEAYRNGTDNLCYDFMISSDGTTYYWMRITAHIFYWEDDNSVRLLVYRQNIDAEKRREQYMFDKMQQDSLTGLYNKAATQEHVRSMMLERPDDMFAFFILDIDNFKQVNDQYGHATGDAVLLEFSKVVRNQFRSGDIIGRIGGDEFVVFFPVPNRDAVERKAKDLSIALLREFPTENGECKISASIGVAVAPDHGTDFETLYKNADEALYHTKERGKIGYTIYDGTTEKEPHQS